MTFDGIIIVIVLIASLWGAHLGFASQLGQLMGLVWGYVASGPIAEKIVPLVLKETTASHSTVNVAVRVLTWVCVYALTRFLVVRILKPQKDAPQSSDRLYGLGLGALKAVVTIWFVASAVMVLEDTVRMKGLKKFAILPQTAVTTRIVRELQPFGKEAAAVWVAMADAEPSVRRRH